MLKSLGGGTAEEMVILQSRIGDLKSIAFAHKLSWVWFFVAFFLVSVLKAAMKKEATARLHYLLMYHSKRKLSQKEKRGDGDS